MKVIMTLILLAVIGCLAIPHFALAACEQTDQHPWGESSDGIRLSIESTDRDGHSLQVAFQNVGDRDVTLNLGSIMANGKVQLPNYIRLNFTDAQGKERLFEFADKKHSFVAGRLDDYVVPLRAGSIYTLKLTLDQFWCRETQEFEVPLRPGENRLTAQFEGRGAKLLNQDMPAIRLMNFWFGKVESNPLLIER
jgi:hypothetical protein